MSFCCPRNLPLVLAALIFCPAALAETLPLKNPGFEEVSQVPGSVPGWVLSQHAGAPSYEMVLDTEAGSGSQTSFRITRLAPQEYGVIHQRISLPANSRGKTLKLSALMKSREVGPDGWRLIISFESAGTLLLSSAVISQAYSPALAGTTDWRRVTVEAKVPERAAAAEVGATLTEAGTGWLDDLSLLLE